MVDEAATKREEAMARGRCACGEMGKPELDGLALHGPLSCRLLTIEERQARDRSTKREQDKAFEESTSLEGKCMECGQGEEFHCTVNGTTPAIGGGTVPTTYLVCPTATFTPYR